MSINREDWINKRAYAIWEENGRLHGRDADNWSKASAEYEALERNRASHDGADVLLRLARKASTVPAARHPSSRRAAA